MKQQLQLQDGRGTSNGLPATAAAGLAGSSASKARQQQLLQLPLDAGEEAVLLAVLRERMAAGESGGHLAPLYLLQVRVCVSNREFRRRDVCADRRDGMGPHTDAGCGGGHAVVELCMCVSTCCVGKRASA